MLRNFPISHQLRNWFNNSLEIRRKEERNRVSLFAREILDSMASRDIEIVRPGLELVADVQNEAAWSRRGGDPLSVAIENFQGTDVTRG
jgi:hypothetical protein